MPRRREPHPDYVKQEQFRRSVANECQREARNSVDRALEQIERALTPEGGALSGEAIAILALVRSELRGFENYISGTFHVVY